MQVAASIQSAIREKLSGDFPSNSQLHFTSIGGGSINEAYRVTAGASDFFCKLNSATKLPQLFIKEQNGLTLLKKHNCIKTPNVISCLQHKDKQILLLEWITEGERTELFWKNFGEQLAMLHRQSEKYFGLDEDNYMGSVPQQNTKHQTWITFFEEERLQPMVERCYQKGLLSQKHLQKFEVLRNKLSTVFNEESPSLLHGDLWSGNFMCNENHEPVLIDPALYYGHRSMDLAMTTLFGGFAQPFYDAYDYHFPLPTNHKEQWKICNLYPLLIHLYLFGNSYLFQIDSILRQFC